MNIEKTIPILRIFDYDKAIEFYITWLGFNIDWEHRFEENAPVYMQVTRGNLTLHLSEHHGDAVPGAKAYIRCTGIREFHSEIISKKYKYNRPALEKAFWGSWVVETIDPFGNKLLFAEDTE